MKILTIAKEIQQQIAVEKKNGKTIGYVPTMGFLHEGHVSLLEKARQENDIVVLTIFVNPLQFGLNEDFDSYPRDIEHDEKVAQSALVDYLFYPSIEEMYPDEVSVKVTVQQRTDVLCGRKRPGHFDGVATVLTKFFNIINPDKVYFGLKDAQQVAVVDGLITDFNFDIDIVPVETVREEDGLAKSSRNVYLLEEERACAHELYKSLNLAREAAQHGVDNPEKLVSLISNHIKNYTTGSIDYIEVYSYPDLKPIEKVSGSVIIALAVQFSTARLIDNVTFLVHK
ncbi:pantoate--beta-alanine ligase [Bacillus cihuensis]|uniref:pantoate--beta-alanine ligase n=1 Tax=Bacillus cihuensis TaxID=1208599 RepID=UPI0003F8F7EA|nr:pantoate--beta-alanine ligase [Bacillus cihuensis]